MKKLAISLLTILTLCAITFTSEAATNWSAYRIMIDPGHGGTDPGASGPTKPHEAELALACGLKLKSFITSNLGGTVKMTRETDTYISLTARKSASVSYDPYIFCSIHLNAFNGTANGTETWYYHSTGNSKNLANRVHATLISQMNRTNRGVKQNGWTVITGSPSVPAILTEGLFVDNKTEHDLIKDKSGDGFLKWVRGHLYGFYNHLKTLKSDITDPKTIAAISGSGTTTTEPTLKVSPATLTSEVTYTDGVSDQMTFNVSGSNLAGAVTLSSDNANFVLSTTSITKAQANSGTEVTVTWSPKAIGTETATIIVKQGTALSKTVKITGTAVAPPLKLKAVWVLSEYNGKASSKGWDATKVRNISYYKGKLYMVYNQKEIKVINAQTGEDLGTLSTNGISGGLITLCDVRVFKGKVYACNLGNSTTPLKIYCWDNDNADPTVVLSTTNVSTATRAGDCMTFSGDLTSGKVVFANDNGTETNILQYAITNGTFATKPTVVKATKTDGTQFKTGASTRCYATSDGTYWITGQHAYSTLLDATGKLSFFIDGNETWGNEIARFKYNSDKLNYALETVYSEINGTNYLKGQMRLLQKGSTWKDSKVVQTIPANGLSQTVSNTSCASSIATSSTTADGLNTVEAWLCVNGQGVCYYISSDGKAPTYDVQPITPTDPEPAVSTDVTALTIPETNIGETATASVKVTGSNLVNDITVTLTDVDNVFTVTPTTIAKGSGSVSKSLTVTYAPASAGSHSATLKIATKKEDGTAISKTISIKATAVEKVVISSDVKLKADWIYSETNSTLSQAPWFSTASPHTRDIAATDSKLYVLTSQPWNTTPVINIIDPATGNKTGNVNVTGITGGEGILGGIEVLDGTLLGANIARATDVLKIYKWASDSQEPTVFISDATHGGVYAGQTISVSGTMTKGNLWTSNGTTVLCYTITNGTAAQTPTVINLTKAGAAYSVGEQKACVQIIPNEDGTFWAIGKDKHPTLFSAKGEYISELSETQIKGKVHGSSGKIFTFGDKTYGAFATYTQPDGQTLSGGALSLVDLTSTAEPAHKSIQPAGGLGTTRNTEFQTAVSHVISNKGSLLNLYIAVPKQGIAKYSYNGAQSGIDEVEGSGKPAIVIENGMISISGGDIKDIHIYNPAGNIVAVSSDISHLSAGIYLIRVRLADGTVITEKLRK